MAVMHNFATLREANVARQKEWDPSDKVDFAWRCNELAGEAGEVCNILKKLHRERVGVTGSRAVKDDLAEELADVVICTDLCGLTAGIGPVGETSWRMVPFDTLTIAGCALSTSSGLVTALLFEQGRHAANAVLNFNLGDAAIRLQRVVAVTTNIARMEGINLPTAIAMKFNSTSHKVGLSTRLRYEPD